MIPQQLKELWEKEANAFGKINYSGIIDHDIRYFCEEGYIAGREAEYLRDKWISVEDVPLFTTSELGWQCTEAGNKDFMAAVPTNKGWWIKHCVVEDGIGLCVVGDGCNEPAGWSLGDITHWMPLPEPPKAK